MMKYKIVEIFHSIQSEGKYAGHAATFIRFFGCNLACKFTDKLKCDEPLHTQKGKMFQLTADEIVEKLGSAQLVVITGGEPSLYNLELLINKIKTQGKTVSVETNGLNLKNLAGADNITYSPKIAFDEKAPDLKYGFHELKLLAGVNNPVDKEKWATVRNKYVQPIGLEDGWDLENVKYCHDFVVANPSWKLSLQTHKIYGAE